MKFNESAIATVVLQNMTEAGFSWNTDWTPRYFKGLLESMAVYLGTVKEDAPKAVYLSDEKQEKKIFFGYVTKEENGYSLDYTFNEEDLPEGTSLVSYDDPVANAVMSKFTLTQYRMVVTPVDGRDLTKVGYLVLLDSIKQYMRTNVGIDPVLEIPEFVIIKGAVENDKLTVSFEPGATLKQHVKDDTAVEG